MIQMGHKASRRKRKGLLYRRIAQELKSDIESGVYADGDHFPSESALQEHYGVSRVTIRTALALLHEEGLIERRRGSGTVVRSHVHHKVLSNIVDFHCEARMMGRKPGSRVLSIAPRKSRIRERIVFDLAPDEMVIELCRLRLLDGVPVVLQTSSHPCYLLEAVSAKDLRDRSLYDFFRREKGIIIGEAEQIIEPYSIEHQEAELLQIPDGTAVMKAHRLTRDSKGRPLELATNLIRGDYYKYFFRLSATEVDG
jgi:GntR family transcriptional regulator